MNLGSTLLKWRIQNKKTQQELAEELGVSQSTLHKWESGKSEIPLRSYSKVCKRLNLSLRTFLGKDILDALFGEGDMSWAEKEKYIQVLEENNKLLKQKLKELEKKNDQTRRDKI